MSNTKKAPHTLFTGGATNNYVREAEDFHATPPADTKKFLDLFTQTHALGRVLEPACGQGHISEVVKAYTAEEVTSLDIVDRGYAGAVIEDFLNFSTDERYDTVITNPPFKFAREFVDKSLEVADGHVIILLKIQFLESRARKEWLENSPLKYVYVNSERVNCWRDGEEINPNTGKPWSGAMLLAWFVWEKGYTGEPIIRWL